MTAARTGRRAQLDSWTNPLRDARDKRLPRIAGPCGLVIFGVTGDLSRKKLMPAIYDLANRGLLPPGFALTGFARRDWDAQDDRWSELEELGWTDVAAADLGFVEEALLLEELGYALYPGPFLQHVTGLAGDPVQTVDATRPLATPPTETPRNPSFFTPSSS